MRSSSISDLVTVALIDEEEDQSPSFEEDCCIDCFMAFCSPPIDEEADIPRYLDFLSCVRCLVALRTFFLWPLRIFTFCWW
jgi:hypothetical protein